MMEAVDQILLVDNSNTRTKMMLSRAGNLLPGQQICPTAQLSEEKLRSLLQEWTFSRVLVCSVVPKAADIFHQVWGERVSFLTPERVRGVAFDYPGLATLGADRLANIQAVARLYPLPCVAVDLGTAATFDVVVPGEGQPRFIGGVIAPGMQAMSRALSSSTAQLPDILPTEPERMIGRDTREAMQAGVVGGYQQMVQGILSSLSKEVGSPLCTVLTGGDAPFLNRCSLFHRNTSPCRSASLYRGDGEECVVDELLTFKGLNLAASLLE